DPREYHRRRRGRAQRLLPEPVGLRRAGVRPVGHRGAQRDHRPARVLARRRPRPHVPLGRPAQRRLAHERQQHPQPRHLRRGQHDRGEPAVRVADHRKPDAQGANELAGAVLTMARALLFLLSLVSLVPFVSAQPPAQPVFRSGARLIVQTVTVKDKDGGAIEGLTPADFIVSEDGEPQTVSWAECQRLPDRPTDARADSPAPRFPAAAAVPSPTQGQIAIPPPGDTRYRDRRLLVLYFDLTAMPPADQMRAYGAAQGFIDTQMQPSDLLAIMTFGGGAVRVKQDFTT